MQDRNFPGKAAMSVITFLKEFKSAYNSCGIHEGAAIWMFKPVLAGLAEAAEEMRVTLSSYTYF